MKSNLFLFISFIFMFSCSNIRDRKNENNNQTENKNSNSSIDVFEKTKSIIWKEIKENEEEVSKNYICYETDSLISFEDTVQIMNNKYYIDKQKKIIADFNKDGFDDIIVQVYKEYGASGAMTMFYLFLTESNNYEFVKSYDDYSLATENIKDKKLISGKFNFENITENKLQGSSTYYGEEDAHCCPTYYTEKEIYEYNALTKKFEIKYQSELKRNNLIN